MDFNYRIHPITTPRMSGKYVPPSRRNAAPPNNITTSLSNDNFPVLSTHSPTIPSTKSGISFSALASEWNEKDEEDAAENRNREEAARNRADAEKTSFFPLRREYNNPEPYIYEVEEDDTRVLLAKAEDDGWKTIEKKARKQWTYEEQMERKRKFEDAEAKMYDESSVWTSGDHRSDDWSHRDRRAV